MNAPFQVEVIPDEDQLYCRIHFVNIDQKEGETRIKPQAFDPTPYQNPDGLSTNWSKYSDAEKSKLNAIKPENYGVISFLVEKVRQIPLRVIHDPTQEPPLNQAHTLILDIPPRKQNDARITMKLRDIAIWEIYYVKTE